MESFKEFIAQTDDDEKNAIKKLMKKYKITHVNQLNRFEKQKYEDDLDKLIKYSKKIM